jgi:hypothetical protein
MGVIKFPFLNFVTFLVLLHKNLNDSNSQSKADLLRLGILIERSALRAACHCFHFSIQITKMAVFAHKKDVFIDIDFFVTPEAVVRSPYQK